VNEQCFLSPTLAAHESWPCIRDPFAPLFLRRVFGFSPWSTHSSLFFSCEMEWVGMS
jgi:hypothetical protein